MTIFLTQFKSGWSAIAHVLVYDLAVREKPVSNKCLFLMWLWGRTICTGLCEDPRAEYKKSASDEVKGNCEAF